MVVRTPVADELYRIWRTTKTNAGMQCLSALLYVQQFYLLNPGGVPDFKYDPAALANEYHALVIASPIVYAGDPIYVSRGLLQNVTQTT
jgi:hypothetical protein